MAIGCTKCMLKLIPQNARGMMVRIMSVKTTIGVRLIGAYAPYESCHAQEKQTFWEQLEKEVSLGKEDSEALIVMSDLNAGHEPLDPRSVTH